MWQHRILNYLGMLLLIPALANIATAQNEQHPNCDAGAVVHVPVPPNSDAASAVAQTYGGRYQPDVPWFALPSAGYGPTNLPGLTGIFLHAPYTHTSGLTDWVGDNPAISGRTEHANITRYWTRNPRYKIVFPIGATRATAIPGSGGYTWGQWEKDVEASFLAYNSVPTAQIRGINTGIINAAYAGAAGAFPGLFATGKDFIWSSFAAIPGPTGNGINEIILTATTNPALAAGGAMTSMIFNPDNGVILECDILVSIPTMFQAAAGALSSPREFTALRHEVGHFFGLDHTNLHPGAFADPIYGILPGPPLAVPFGTTRFDLGLQNVPDVTGQNFVRVGTIAHYPWGTADGIGRFPIPGMSGRITHCGIGFDHVSTPLHTDDATSLSKIYPVRVPRAGKIPLINVSARIIGRQRAGSTINSSVAGRFGKNVWVMPANEVSMNQPQAQSIAYPRSGTLSGISRLSTTDCVTLSHYVRPANHTVYGNEPQSESFFRAIPSVVGATRMNGHQPNSLATGDFSIDGILAGSWDLSNPVAYDIAFERGGSLGAESGRMGEWFFDSVANGAPALYQGNLITTPALLGPPGGFELAGLMKNRYGSTTQESGLRTVPGTVIALDPREHDDTLLADQFQIALSGLAISLPFAGNGVEYFDLTDEYTRPLVDVQPRTGFVPGGVVTISIKPTNPTRFNIDLPTLTCFVNNVSLTWQKFMASFPSLTVAYDPTISEEITLTIDMDEVEQFSLLNRPPVGCKPNAGGIHFKILVNEKLAPNGPALNATYLAIGRNDVIF